MREFLKHNKGYIGIYLLSLFITSIYCYVQGYMPFNEVIYIFIMNLFILVSFLSFKYYKDRGLYKLFKSGITSLESAISNLGYGILSESVSKILKEQYNLYVVSIKKYKKIYKEHLDFINIWVHQMKTPLSIIALQVKEFEGEEIEQDIKEELGKLNKGLNLVMYYSRLDSFERDFLIESLNLQSLVKEAINENKRLFIKNKIMPRVLIDESIEVYSDTKWLKFVLDQLITNGVKYSRDKGKEVIISACQDGNIISLSVEDMGVGISKQDIKRVFDKFFTGENGRKFGESTGMGLYISKQICEKLGHKIEIESVLNKGTKVTIKLKDLRE